MMRDKLFQVETIKKFLEITAALASLTVLLYACGYIADYAHDRMLGISGFEPAAVYYLVSGGTFFISTLYALYSTIVSHFYYFLLFFVIIAAILLYEDYAKKKNAAHLPKPYAAAASIVIFIYLFVVIPIFTSTFAFENLLLPKSQSEPDFYYSQFKTITAEMWTWILNESEVNKLNLTARYVLLILSSIISVFILYSLVRQWKRWKKKPGPSKPGTGPGRFKPLIRLLEHLSALPKIAFALLIVLTVIIVAVQIVTIPINYGILIKSNLYPEVKVEVQGTELLENHDPGKESKVWLLKEGVHDLLVYAVFFQKDRDDPVYKLFTLKKNLVKKIEILDNSFVFKYK
ncbi:MAG: hypothetical protein GTO45_40925 [Candidatus Aminicenantes bacterium]|nr:hypothetical protein [Candidatus Aminicenantes bacterium]NIM84969.1 hypothetical protein [Candidatus Aminicenantes bacterium]NIN24483.1 hypothetical protein [Candidatus Aminicenantes bacterium]NIN48247.1 hypothetical protein [Candidatus Aminicenantes bacterium]NIN91150.1 hypothetical protein [Candidatus Aminicenantes bacterium]